MEEVMKETECPKCGKQPTVTFVSGYGWQIECKCSETRYVAFGETFEHAEAEWRRYVKVVTKK